MTIADFVLEKLRQLPADKQRQVLDYATSLLPSGTADIPAKRNPAGILAHWRVDISANEIDENRNEMLSGFPRDDL